jgi:hypothetical protein
MLKCAWNWPRGSRIRRPWGWAERGYPEYVPLSPVLPLASKPLCAEDLVPGLVFDPVTWLPSPASASEARRRKDYWVAFEDADRSRGYSHLASR